MPVHIDGDFTEEERRGHIREMLEDHEEETLEEVRPVTERMFADLTEDERDVTMLVAALVMQPTPGFQERFASVRTEDTDIVTWAGWAKITPEELSRGRQVASECCRLRGIPK